MRLIPGKTKVKIELFRGITIGDLVVGGITLALAVLFLLSTFPGRLYITLGLIAVGATLIFRIDDTPNYMLLLGILRYLAIPRSFRRTVSDAQLLAKQKEEQDGEE